VKIRDSQRTAYRIEDDQRGSENPPLADLKRHAEDFAKKEHPSLQWILSASFMMPAVFKSTSIPTARYILPS